MALLGNLTGSSQFFNDTAFYNGVATQSLRFDDGSSTYLGRTPSSASNRKTFTFSAWVKRGNIGTNQDMFNAGVNNGSLPRTEFRFKSDDTISIGFNPSATTWYYSITTRVFRDVSSWYHLILSVDTTQSTSTDRVKLYVNGELQTFASQSVPSQNTDLTVNNTVGHSIGVYGGGNRTSSFYDGYMAEVNFVDGNAYDASYFGETKNGVWIAKKYTGSYGTNGFRLQFNQTGVGTASSSTIGADTSGNTNHYTSSNIVASDCNMPDSPENNFCTLNPNARGTTNVALSEGNLKFVKSSANFGNVLGTMPLFSGKWYCEAYITSSNLTQVGVQEVTNNIYTSSGDFGPNTDLGMWDSRGYYYDEGTAGGSPPTYTTGDIINIAFDVDAGKIWFGKNNTYNHSGDPANGTNQTTGSTDDLSSIGVTIAGNGENGGTAVYNCGQDSSFLGNKTAQGNTDGNGIGDFYYAPPSGFLAMCTANLPEPTIGSNSATQADDHFNTVLWTGNSSTQSITGIGFQPDWLWIKSRNQTHYHGLFDSNRGSTKRLFANETDAESTQSAGVTSFDSDGFSLGSNAGQNQTAKTYVAWNWKANGGTTSSNTDGSITSTVQANTTAGFSIVTYTGNATSGATVGHGLGVAPKFVIIKNRDTAGNWTVRTTALDGSSDYFQLNLTDAISNSSRSAPTSTVFSIGGGDVENKSGDDLVAYCFAEVEGYSKFGSYTGNGSTDGTFVHLGFRPAWVMIKRTDSTNHWLMLDNTRDVDNPVHKFLLANKSDVENTSNDQDVDFLSNGFKTRNSNARNNASGGTYIYMAFAEAPFKYANGR